MNNEEFTILGKKECSSLFVVQKNEGVLGGNHFINADCDIDNISVNIKMEQCIRRMTTLSVDAPITMERLWRMYTTIEHLLMLFDGRFYIVESATFAGSAVSEEEYTSYSNECIARRLLYYNTDPAYCYHAHQLLSFEVALSPMVIKKWIQLQNELDIVHQFVLYSIANTGITHDVKCANLIECIEPIVEIIGIHDPFFPNLRPGERTTTLKICIDAVISKYGKDIFTMEFSKNKEKFLQILVNTRNRIMHIKRNQPTGKYLSGSQSILYWVKLIHLYRVVLLSLIGIDCYQYRSLLIESVEQWNSWNEVMNNFLSLL